MLYSQTAFEKSVYYFVVLGGYCYLDLSLTFGKLSSNLSEVTPKIIRDWLQFFHSTLPFQRDNNYKQ